MLLLWNLTEAMLINLKPLFRFIASFHFSVYTTRGMVLEDGIVIVAERETGIPCEILLQQPHRPPFVQNHKNRLTFSL